MSTTLQDAFVIPDQGALSALDFVIRLDADRSPAAMARLVDDYVVTPAVAEALPVLFDHMHTAVTRGEAYGHILHGGFGSGKSHLMTMLSLLLEDQPSAWAKSHPAFAQLQSTHHRWVTEQKLLVVRVHMLSRRRSGSSLDEVLYATVNETLTRAGKAPFVVSDVQQVIRELEAEAATYGDQFWTGAASAGVIDSAESLEAVKAMGVEGLQAVANEYLRWKGRTAQAQGLTPPWGEGLKRLAHHIRGQGYGGLVLLVDEFLLWLAEHTGDAFVAAINDMNTIVDFAGRRDVPIIVVFARQKNIKEFFPDLTDQDRIQDRVDHHAKRFEVTRLQDVELRYIVKGRVLRDKRDPQAIADALVRVRKTYKRALDQLVGDAGADVLDDVFPFHPALIDVLVDVSNLMQRERSALRLLYEVLAANGDMPLDTLLPVGRVFEHVFPPAGVDAARKAETLQKIHHEWYEVLAPRVDAYVRLKTDQNDPVSDERAQTLRQALKTVLLGLVSPRLAGRGNERLTVERLVKLNFADANGSRMSNKLGRLATDLTDFQVLLAPELQITGEREQAVISYALGQASLGEVLRRARDKVQNKSARLAVLRERLEALLPRKLEGLVSAGVAGKRHEVIWRGTKRRGTVLFGNVREQAYDTFVPAAGDDFRVIVDYPWDDPGHTFGEDIARVAAVRKKRGVMASAAWLPRHLDTHEMRLLHELAAARRVIEEGESGELLASYGASDRTLLLEQARNRATVLRRGLDAALLQAYDEQGEVKALIGPRDPDLGTGKLDLDLDRIVRELLDRRYPQHPAFQRSAEDRKEEASRTQLKAVEDFLRKAWGQSGSIHFDGDTAGALERVGKPLELVEVGTSRAGVHHHGRFVKEVVAELGDHGTVSWAPIAEKLREPPFGLTQDVVDLMLVYVCLGGYRLRTSSGDRVDARVGLGAGTYTLEKAALLELAPWSRARTLASQVLDVRRADAHRSLSAQDKLAMSMATAARGLRQDLSTLHARLVQLGSEGTPRLAQVKELLDLLGGLVRENSDSYTILTEFLGRWPEDDAPHRDQLKAVKGNLSALETLDRTSRGHLIRARTGRLGARIETALGELNERLSQREQVRPLRRLDVESFNREAQAIVQELLVRPPVHPPEPPVFPPQPGEERKIVQVPDASTLKALLAELVEMQREGRLVSIEVVTRIAARSDS